VSEKPGSGGAYHVVLSALDRATLIEHGGSIGAHYRDLLNRYKCGNLDESGYPHDGNGCPADCPHEIACA
jgi:hypothetical protein